MKYLIFILALIFIVGCQETANISSQLAGNNAGTTPTEDEAKTGSENTNVDEDHIGCQPGEILEDGTCVPAMDNNAGIFDELDESLTNTQMVEYMNGVEGFLAEPVAEGTYPGIIMIHEWWGLNDNIKTMAQLLAQEGYVVLAVDMYEGRVAETSADAGMYAGEVRGNPEKAVANMGAAKEYLEALPNVEKIGSLGWCFGGQQSLQVSLNEKLDATVIYYGSLTDDKEQLDNIDWPVLGIFGEEDTGIPVDSVRSFESALDDLGIQNEVYIYPGVGHAFANPSGSNYAKDETIDAWDKTVSFLDKTLKSSSDTKTFIVTGENYKFVMDGVNNPDIIVNQGDTVRIEFTSTSGMHDWVVDEFDARTEIVRAPNSTYVEFVADMKGEFEYYCSVGQHRENGMTGKLIVE